MVAASAPVVDLVKLGGSLITVKNRDETPRREVMARLAEEIAASGRTGDLVLGHGSGSFGHAAVQRRGGDGAGLDAAGIADVQDAAARLHRMVIAALREAGNAPFSVAPSSWMTARDGRPVDGALVALEKALPRGLLPVVYGDVVIDRMGGATIASTEAVLLFIVRRLRRHKHRIGRVLWLGETDGVLDGRGRTIPTIDGESYDWVCRQIVPTRGYDVTGGMMLRLQATRALARCGVESWIVNGLEPGLLRAGLQGEELPGTRVLADVS